MGLICFHYSKYVQLELVPDYAKSVCGGHFGSGWHLSHRHLMFLRGARHLHLTHSPRHPFFLAITSVKG